MITSVAVRKLPSTDPARCENLTWTDTLPQMSPRLALALVLIGCTACATSSMPAPAVDVVPSATAAAPVSASGSVPALASASGSAPVSAPEPDGVAAARGAIAAALAIPAGELGVAGDVGRADGRWSYACAWHRAKPHKRSLLALRRCALPAATVCVAKPIPLPHATVTIAGFVDLEGEPRNDLLSAGVSKRLPQAPDGMKHPALWVLSDETDKSALVVVDVAGGAFTKVLETSLMADEVGRREVVRRVSFERGAGGVLDLVLLGKTLPLHVEGVPGPLTSVHHRWSHGAYRTE